jgi:Tfp pilus assembly protein PilX
MALVLSLVVLMALTGILVAFLSASSFEPQISKNLSDTTRARYLAESGVELAFNQLIATSSWSTLLTGATSTGQWVVMLNNATLPGLTSGSGTFTVSVRNDANAGDTAITGQASADGAFDTDSNGIVIMRATGTYGTASRTFEVVARRLSLPPFPGAVNIPGAQSDTYINTQTFTIDGRSYSCSSNCDIPNNWTAASGNPAKYGIATQTGTQSNNGNSYETNVENAVGTNGSCNTSCSNAKKANIKGKSEVDGTYTTGLDTIQADTALTPSVMESFLNKLAAFPGTQVYQSTLSCRMILSGGSNSMSQSSANTSLTNAPTLSNGCGLSKTLDLGSRTDPKLVYFKGDWDPTSAFTGLEISSGSGIKGAGILVIEDGDFKNYGAIEWDGIIISHGAFVTASFRESSNTIVRGVLTALEDQAGEASGYFDFYLHGSLASFSTKFSQQNLDMVQGMRGLHALTGWREI